MEADFRKHYIDMVRREAELDVLIEQRRKWWDREGRIRTLAEHLYSNAAPWSHLTPLDCVRNAERVVDAISDAMKSRHPPKEPPP
jgi:hypothetical protein